MTEKELYKVYSEWTGALHFFAIRDLGHHLDCEYFPGEYQFKIYSGWVEEYSSASGIPGLSRPPGERSETVQLLRPEDNPSQEDLRALFRAICLAAARVLKVNVAQALLP
jgi:hypothetical protein